MVDPENTALSLPTLFLSPEKTLQFFYSVSLIEHIKNGIRLRFDDRENLIDFFFPRQLNVSLPPKTTAFKDYVWRKAQTRTREFLSQLQKNPKDAIRFYDDMDKLRLESTNAIQSALLTKTRVQNETRETYRKLGIAVAGVKLGCDIGISVMSNFGGLPGGAIASGYGTITSSLSSESFSLNAIAVTGLAQTALNFGSTLVGTGGKRNLLELNRLKSEAAKLDEYVKGLENGLRSKSPTMPFAARYRHYQSSEMSRILKQREIKDVAGASTRWQTLAKGTAVVATLISIGMAWQDFRTALERMGN